MARSKYISSSCAVSLAVSAATAHACHLISHCINCLAKSQRHVSTAHPYSLLQIITNSAASFYELEFCYSQLNLPPKCITLIIL
ncbi:hypothetical protein ACOSQ2_017285 [Xanthoceras sorbifolium]